MSLSNREGGGGRQTVSQETCQLWYGDDEFQITRFDCTELTFRFTECMYLWRKAILYNPAASFMRWIFYPFGRSGHGQEPAAERDFFMPVCRPQQSLLWIRGIYIFQEE